jgi:hypothetical protein
MVGGRSYWFTLTSRLLPSLVSKEVILVFIMVILVQTGHMLRVQYAPSLGIDIFRQTIFETK